MGGGRSAHHTSLRSMFWFTPVFWFHKLGYHGYGSLRPRFFRIVRQRLKVEIVEQDATSESCSILALGLGQLIQSFLLSRIEFNGDHRLAPNDDSSAKDC